jgi:lysophospholipase L1-like esterase
MPIIKAKGAKPAVIIPPLPRYLFTRCCSDADHCTNANEENFSAKLLTNFVQLRNELIKQLVSEGITNFKVMDLCCVTNCSLTANTASRLEELKKVTASDGVHFTGTGYTNLAKRCSDCLKTLLGSMCNPKGKKAVPVTFFWRGF